MKTKILLSTLFICLFALSGNAQKLFVLENANSTIGTRTYNNLSDAITNLQINDYLYIPGGIYSQAITIDVAGVSIIGTGHHPDSSGTMGTTTFLGDFTIRADSVFVEGIKIDNYLRIRSSTTNLVVNNTIISKCHVTYNILLYGSLGSPETNNTLIKECVIGTWISGGETSSALIQNNIIVQNIGFFNGSGVVIKNNIFLRATSNPVCGGQTCDVLTSIKNATIENNIFNVIDFANVNTSVFINNIDMADMDAPTFVGGTLPNTFSYSFDFHNSSYDKGIYKGDYVYSEIPTNPQFNATFIGAKTNATGQLQINFNVSAQNQQ